MLKQKKLSKEQAIQKLRHYCSYQERCHSEVKEKLYSFGLYKTEVEECISMLIESDHLNEERFAREFAGGKFRMKQWGKIKIRYELKSKLISDYCINKALGALPDEDYNKTLQKLARAKWGSLKSEKNIFAKMKKTQDYLLQKGFESNFVSQQVANLRKNNNDEAG